MTSMLSTVRILCLSSMVRIFASAFVFLTVDHFTVGIDIVVNWNDVIRQTSLRRFRAHKRWHSKHIIVEHLSLTIDHIQI